MSQLHVCQVSYFVTVDFDKESVCVADTYVVTFDFDVTATCVSGKLLCHSGL